MIRLRWPEGEDGSALVLALVFLALFGLFIAALLTLAATSEKVTGALRTQGAQVYAADGAVQAAINYIRPTSTQGVDPASGGTCSTPPVSVTVNGVTPVVTCQGLSGSGVAAVNTAANTPPYAILTLATSTANEDGLAQGSNNALVVGGNVVVDSNINVSTAVASMQVSGTVKSSICFGSTNYGSGTVTSSVAGYPICTATPIQDPGITDTTYSPPSINTTARTPPGSCTGGTVTLQPGTYTSAAALSALTGTDCVVVFTKGVYYFNFADATPVWNISKGVTSGKTGAVVIGGTGFGATGCDASQPGVAFLFDRASQVSITAGTMSLCATPSASNQQIAVYGLKGSPQAATVQATSASSSGSPAFSNPSNGQALDGALATASVNKNSASEVLQSYSNPAIPAGAQIDSARLRIRHQETGNTTNASLSLVATTGATTVANTSIPIRASTTDDSTADLSAALNSAAKISALAVTYTVTNTKNPQTTENLDGIVLDVTYHTTPYTGENGTCITVPLSLGGCSLIATNGSKSNLFVTGTVYAPLAHLDVSLPNQAQQLFGRGVIARSLSVNLPHSGAGGSSIFAPAITFSSGVANRDVLFTAQMNGVTVLLAEVLYDDSVSPGKVVTVKSWSVRQ